MKRLLITAAALTAGLVLCTSAEAGHGSSGSSGHSSSSSGSKSNYSSSYGKNYSSPSQHYNHKNGSNYSKNYNSKYGSHHQNYHSNNHKTSSKWKSNSNYHLKYGTKFSHGYFYKGKYHNHWSYCCYDFRYCCDIFWDPCCYCWYYYCVPADCYYPVSYCPYRTYCWIPASTECEVEVCETPPCDADEPPVDTLPECPPPVCDPASPASTNAGSPGKFPATATKPTSYGKTGQSER
jgi:hypothetical protein